MHKFGTNPWKLSFKNISLDALVLKEYDIFGLLHIYIYIFWLQNMVTISDSGAGPKRSAPACSIYIVYYLYVLISTYVVVRGLAQC